MTIETKEQMTIREKIIYSLGIGFIFLGIVYIGIAKPIEWKFGYYNWYTVIFLLVGCFFIALNIVISFFQNTK